MKVFAVTSFALKNYGVNGHKKEDIKTKQNFNKNVDRLSFQANMSYNKTLVKNYANITTDALYALKAKVFANPKYQKEYVKTSSVYALLFYDKVLSNKKLSENDALNKIVSDVALSIKSGEELNFEMALLDKFLENPNLINSDNVCKYLEKIMKVSMTQPGFRLSNKILSEECLYTNEDIMNNALVDFGKYSFDSEENNIKSNCIINVLDIYMSDKRLYGNKNIRDNIGRIASEAKSPLKVDLVSQILSHDCLINKSSFAKKIPTCLYFTRSQEECKNKIDIVEKYVNNPELVKNKNVNIVLPELIYCSYSNYCKQLVEKILSDEKLYDNNNLMKNVDKLLNGVVDKRRFSLAEEILSNEEIYGNVNYISNKFPDLMLYSTDDKKVAIAKRIISNPKLYNSSDVYKHLDKIIGEEKTNILDEIEKSNN